MGPYALLGGLNRAILGAPGAMGADAERRPFGMSRPSEVKPMRDDRMEKNCLNPIEALRPKRS